MLDTHQTHVPACPDRLSDEQVERYWRDGYLAFEGALTGGEVADGREALSEIVRRYAFDRERCDYRRAKTDEEGNYTGAVFQVRGSRCGFQLEPGQEPAADAAALEQQVRKFMWFEEAAEVFSGFCSKHPRTFGLAEQLLGGKSVLYQSMALIKPAFHGSEKPWHQDNAYFAVEDMDHVCRRDTNGFAG